jgi:hypothetical protein
MYKSKHNIAFEGKTYFVGDIVPDHVALAMDKGYTVKPVIKNQPTSETELSRKGE